MGIATAYMPPPTPAAVTGGIAVPAVATGGVAPVPATPSVLPYQGTVNPQANIINPNATNAQVPATGLIGSEQALQGGLTGGVAAINNGQQQANTALNSAISGVDDNSAAKLQADLTGANGPAAKAQAQTNFAQSPAAAYQQEQMQRATERSAAARGGLLSGNTLTELQRNAAGIASQDYQNQFANLGTVADRTLQNNTLKASLKRDLADTAMSAGINTGGLITQTAGQVAQGRTNAGNAIAANATEAASNISNLLNQQGIVVSDAFAKDISTITDMIYQAGIQDSDSSKNLAAILANIAGGQASTVANGQAQIGASNAAGTIGVSNAIQNGIQQGVNYFGTPTAPAAKK
ncbi:MAG: hypothetical protein V4440_12205 [Pseudomonadota bacterium]